jgi:hypothetical protein
LGVSEEVWRHSAKVGRERAWVGRHGGRVERQRIRLGGSEGWLG